MTSRNDHSPMVLGLHQGPIDLFSHFVIKNKVIVDSAESTKDKKVRPQKAREVKLLHRVLGNLHVFTSEQIPGLSAGHKDLKTAYEMALNVAGVISSLENGSRVRFTGEDAGAVAKRLKNTSGTFVLATRK